MSVSFSQGEQGLNGPPGQTGPPGPMVRYKYYYKLHYERRKILLTVYGYYNQNTMISHPLAAKIDKVKQSE